MKNNLICVVLFLGWSFSSCNGWLDVTPETEKEEKEMFKTVTGFKDALISCYIKLNDFNLYGRRLTITDIEFMAQHWSWEESNYTNQRELKNFNYEAEYSKSFFKAVYKGLYNTIAQANIILKNMSMHKNMIKDEQIRAIIEGEALAIRAFCHLDILRLFGQMPQNPVKTVMLPYAKTVSSEQIPYYSFSEFVNLILQDLDAAEALFDNNDPLFEYSYTGLNDFFSMKDSFLGGRRFRFNYYAVKALKARLYMYIGEKEKAYTFALEIINAQNKYNKNVLTLAGKEDFEKANYTLPSECILALSNSALLDLFSSSANRLFLTEKQFTQDLFAGQSVTYNNRTKLWDRTAVDGVVKPILKKYDQPKSSENIDISVLATEKQVIPLIRLSEMYLIAMECAPTLSDANRFYVEYMRAREVMAAALTQEQLMTEILREYRREFFAEGQMFYTYKRLGITKMLWKSDREVGEHDYVIPLPSTELSEN